MELAPAIAKSPIRLVLRPLLWFCAASLLAPLSPAQCSYVSQVPDQTISSGAPCFSNNGTLTAAGVTINAGAQVSFIAGGTVRLAPGFRATAGTAGTTFHAWAEALPSVVSVTPASGSGLNQQFTWRVSSPYGHANISHMLALINTAVTGVNGCFIFYHRSANLLHLADNASNGWSAGFAPGSAGSTSNSYCTINGIGSSVSGSGNELALTVSIAFQSAFAGAKNNYLNAYNNEGLYTDWQHMGTWTIPAPTMLYSAIPQSIGGGGSCVLTADPPAYTIQRVNGNQINVSARMTVNGPVQGNWRVTVQLFVFFSGQSFGHGIPDTTVNFSPATTINTQYGPIGSVSLEPRGSGEYWIRAVTWGVCNNTTTYYAGSIGDSFHFPVQRPTVFVPDSNGNPTGLTSADFWYLGGAASTDGYYTQYRLAMNPNTTPDQGTYSHLWLTNDNTKLDLTPENPATRVIIVSKGSSSPGFPSGEITVKASLNGFTSLAFQVRINTPRSLRMGNDGAAVTISCRDTFEIPDPRYEGFRSSYLYSILDLNGNVLNPITTHETLENRLLAAGVPESNWGNPPDRATWTPAMFGSNDLTENQPAFIDELQACVGPAFIELTPVPLDPNPNSTTIPVVNFTQKFWVGTSTPTTTNTFTGTCVQRNVAVLRLNTGSVESKLSPATPAQCAANVFVN